MKRSADELESVEETSRQRDPAESDKMLNAPLKKRERFDLRNREPKKCKKSLFQNELPRSILKKKMAEGPESSHNPTEPYTYSAVPPADRGGSRSSSPLSGTSRGSMFEMNELPLQGSLRADDENAAEGQAPNESKLEACEKDDRDETIVGDSLLRLKSLHL